MKPCKTIPILAALAISAAATQSDSTKVPCTELEKLTVTAERFPIKEVESDRFVTILTGEELKESGGNNLMDALKRTSGLAYKAFGPMGLTHGGMGSSLSFRGIKGGELILLNGVNIQGAASYGYDINMLSIDNIERVEIVRGGASTIYGSNAMSGVINIITKESADLKSLRVHLEGGTEEFVDAKISGQAKGIALGFGYQHIGEEDVSWSMRKYSYTADPIDKLNWNANYNLRDKFFVDYLGSFNTSAHSKNFEDPEKESIKTEQDQFSHFANIRYVNDEFQAKLYGNYDLMKRQELDSDDPEDKNKNYNAGLDLDYRIPTDAVTINMGFSSIYRAADYNNKYQKKYDAHTATYVQLKKDLLDRVIFSSGLRFQNVLGGTQSKNYDIFLPSAGASVRIFDQLRLFGNFAKSFRTPTFNQLYYKSDFLEGNEDLKPESGYTYEGGMKVEFPAVGVRLAGFYMDYSDKIIYDGSTDVKRYVNAGEFTSKGIEWKVDFRLGAFAEKLPVVLSAGGYYADPVAKEKGDEPEQTGPKFHLNSGVKYMGEKLVVDLNNTLTAQRERNLDDYVTLNFFTSYRLWRGKLFFSVDNITDRQNITYGDFTPDSKSQYAYYDLGRQFKLGYEFDLFNKSDKQK